MVAIFSLLRDVKSEVDFGVRKGDHELHYFNKSKGNRGRTIAFVSFLNNSNFGQNFSIC